MHEMKKKQNIHTIERFDASISNGLTDEQVQVRQNQKLVNNTKQKTSKSYFKIFFENIFTFFNMLWVLIFAALIWVKSYENLFFIFIVIANTGIAIFQEIRSKKTVEKLSMVTSPKTTVVRNGKEEEILSSSIVLDDVLVLEIGNQIPTDCIILNGSCEVNESLLTGESKPVKRQKGETLLAGSFITSGKCFAKADKIGKQSYIQTLASAAKKFKQPNSNLFRDLKAIIKYIGIIIIPLGALTFLNCYYWSTPAETLKHAIELTCGSMTGMIPAGMFLLISVALAVGVIKLANKRTLVQDIYSIEMLARSNILCLDKTGTITDGTMSVKEIATSGISEEDLKSAMAKALNCQNTENNTSKALVNFFGKENCKALYNIPFSSDRKFTATTIDGFGTIVFGASEYVKTKIPDEFKNKIESATNDGFRVLVVATSKEKLKDDNLPKNLTFNGIIVIEDTIRKDAVKTIKWFKENNVEIKIISGDDPRAVSAIAKRVGVENAENFVNLEGKSAEEVKKLALSSTVFGRVTPEQKHIIIKELKKQNVVAMTGDGVNDTLALKEADCSIAMAEGSEVARNISHLVLLDSQFSTLPMVVEEGRRVINNVQKSSTLFLMKTFMMIFLSIILLSSQISFIFENKNLFLLEMFVIGLPSFFLALQPNKNLIEGNFITNVLKRSLPFGALLLINILSVVILGKFGILTASEEITAATIALTLCGFLNLLVLCQPFTKLKIAVCAFSVVGITACALILPYFFGLTDITLKVVKVCLTLVLISAICHIWAKIITSKIKKIKKQKG
ncbi:MAG: HAD-IC family P-type ATPase [Clostridia bacterium]|nr:HAD-IC family P-type ATPase [Clostridia bacterium]